MVAMIDVDSISVIKDTMILSLHKDFTDDQ